MMSLGKRKLALKILKNHSLKRMLWNVKEALYWLYRYLEKSMLMSQVEYYTKKIYLFFLSPGTYWSTYFNILVFQLNIDLKRNDFQAFHITESEMISQQFDLILKTPAKTTLLLLYLTKSLCNFQECVVNCITYVQLLYT